MKYVRYTFEVVPVLPAREVLVAELAERGFESFVDTETGLEAYIPMDQDASEITQGLMAEAIVGQHLSIERTEMDDVNWNAAWESSFQPIVVADRMIIRAPFHSLEKIYPVEIVIEPKMSFGTGHHSTTYLIAEAMLDMDLRDKVVLDMGSGTGVLAILSEKQGAQKVDAIDIDVWAYDNALENMERNDCRLVRVLQGGAELLGDTIYDVILANINRNILVRDMEHYARVLRPGGNILFSGFYPSDVSYLLEVATPLGLYQHDKRQRDEWCMVWMVKNESSPYETFL
jgi:ribosomal protein L11 methyltransferase